MCKLLKDMCGLIDEIKHVVVNKMLDMWFRHKADDKQIQEHNYQTGCY